MMKMNFSKRKCKLFGFSMKNISEICQLQLVGFEKHFSPSVCHCCSRASADLLSSDQAPNNDQNDQACLN
jgi:hypothetical protein